MVAAEEEAAVAEAPDWATALTIQVVSVGFS